MKDYLNTILDTITEMPPSTVVGGLILAFLLALPMAWAYAACRRNAVRNDAEVKGEAHALLLVVLATVANLIGMAVASGYGAFSLRLAQAAAYPYPPRHSPGAHHFPGPPEGLARGVTRDIFKTSDANHDGLLSVDEATAAAAALIRTAAGEGKDTVDAKALSAALQERLKSPDRRPRTVEAAIKKRETGPG